MVLMKVMRKNKRHVLYFQLKELPDQRKLISTLKLLGNDQIFNVNVEKSKNKNSIVIFVTIKDNSIKFRHFIMT